MVGLLVVLGIIGLFTLILIRASLKERTPEERARSRSQSKAELAQIKELFIEFFRSLRTLPSGSGVPLAAIFMVVVYNVFGDLPPWLFFGAIAAIIILELFIVTGKTSTRAPRTGRPAIPTSVKRSVYARDGGACRYCGSRQNLEYDHIIPYSKGGADSVGNLQILCRSCNRSKGARI